MTSTAVLALGSNLGDRERNVRAALADLALVRGVTIEGASGLYETPALTLAGVDETAPAYLNAVVMITTTLDPYELLAATASIENAHGRVRTERWGARTLDIDIVTFDDLRQDDPTLTLPHPRAAERGFVLVPWRELDPDAVLPGVGRIDALPAASESVPRYPAEALA